MIIDDIDIDKFKLRPNHVLLFWRERLSEKKGIIIPDPYRRKSCMSGDIIKLGRCLEYPELAVGQAVMFDGVCDKEFVGPRTGLERHIIIRAEEIMGILDYNEVKAA